MGGGGRGEEGGEGRGRREEVRVEGGEMRRGEERRKEEGRCF